MLVALAAVIVGPFISGWIAHRQIISSMRQQWIDNLRVCVAEFLAEVNHILLYYNPIDHKDSLDPAASKKIDYLENRIELILNPKKKRSQRLINLVHDLADITVKRNISNEKQGDEYGRLSVQIIEATQEVIQAEWKKTRDIFYLPDTDDEQAS